MPEERWKDVEGFSNYEVSDRGRVRNIEKDFILKLTLDKSTGYMVVSMLGDDGKRYKRGVHTLVAKAFLLNPEKKRVVNHKDADKTNNILENLEWSTDSENMLHAFKNGLCENTRTAASNQIKYLHSLPKTQRQRESARENLVKINQREKTARQLEASMNNINSQKCRQRAKESHYDRHPPIKVIETGEIYRSQRELAERLGMSESSICACLKGRRQHACNYHFEYVNNISQSEKSRTFLYNYQMDAVNHMKNGCILCGSVGSGKSRTGLFYYFKENGGWIDGPNYTPMTNPSDLIIITTAKKRNSYEWLGELAHFRISDKPELNYYKNKVVIDSWNNLPKYKDVENTFFLFDEQRLVGSGAWVKTFLRIAKRNRWILLSATPGDSYMDFLPVFLANGFFKNKTEFAREHIIYSRFTKYPKIDRFIGTQRLEYLRRQVLVEMDYKHEINAHHEDIYCRYDIAKYKDTIRSRFDPFKNEPIQQASGLCYVLRRIVNSDESRQAKMLEILEDHPKAIIFYSFDYELEILKNLAYGDDVVVAEYNGHRHDLIPTEEKWVYLCQYTSACEGWECTKTNCIIFYSQNYSYKVMAQAAGRIDRLNTPFKDLYYYHLKTRSGIDLAISKALSQKKQFNESRWVKW